MVRDIPVPLPQPIMMHDFAITRNYALILDVPLVFDPKVCAQRARQLVSR